MARATLRHGRAARGQRRSAKFRVPTRLKDKDTFVIMTKPKTTIARRTNAAAAALFAAGVLFASIAPAAAVGMPPKPAPATTAQPRNTISDAEVMALAEQPLEQALAYCESRFRSYDRTTGTYLGYDGNEHACP